MLSSTKSTKKKEKETLERRFLKKVKFHKSKTYHFEVYFGVPESTKKE
jgi:hypothetical protein